MKTVDLSETIAALKKKIQHQFFIHIYSYSILALSVPAMEKKLLAGIEELKVQQQINTRMLQQVLQHLQVGKASAIVEEASTELPDDIDLPLRSKEEVLALDEKLQDCSTMKQLVGITGIDLSM